MIFYPGKTNYIANSPGIQTSFPHGLSALYSSLTAFWKMDEASGNGADSIGSATLTDVNTVTSGTGLVYPTARQFATANTEYMTTPDSAALSTGDIQFWVACWFKITADSGVTMGLISKDSSITGREYRLEAVRSALNVYKADFFVSKANTNLLDVAETTTMAMNTWHLMVGYHDSVGNVIGVSSDAAAPTTAAYTFGVNDTTGIVTIGRLQENASWYMNGLIGPVMFGKNYIPTQGDLDFLYNGGAGRTLDAMKDY